MAVEYFISVFDPVPSKNLHSVGVKILGCKNLFTTNTPASMVRVQRTASYSVDNGKRNDNARGVQLREEGIEMFDTLSQTVVARALLGWKESGHFSEAEINAAFMRHRMQSPHRTKLLSVESVGTAGFPQARFVRGEENSSNFTIGNGELFSALRIVDSSPIMKSYGRRREVPKQSELDTKEVAEQVFKDFDLNQALSDRGIPRANFTWSLGLGNIRGKQDSALLTLFAQVADLLDLHYNGRNFLHFNHTNAIKAENVDIVFYANETLTPRYQEILEISPLPGKDGYPLVFQKHSKNFYIFHIKGSDFIAKFFNLRFHQPLYGNKNGLRNEQEIKDFYVKGLKAHYDKIPENAYRVRDLDDFFVKIESLVVEYLMTMQKGQPTQAEFFSLLARFIKLRDSLPDNIFEQSFSQATQQRVQAIMASTLGRDVPKEAGISYFLLLEMLLRDPVQFLINRTSQNGDLFKSES